MAVTKEDLLYSIQVDVKDAASKLKEIQDQLDGLSGKSGQADALGLGFVKLQAAISVAQTAMVAFKKIWDQTVSAWREDQDRLTMLGNTFAILGEKNVASATLAFEEYASALQDTTTVSKDAAMTMLQQAKIMGLTDDKAKQLVKTAVNVAAAYGGDAKSRFDQLAGSLRGMTRGISELDPKLKGMSEQAGKSGQAIDYFAEKLDGFAERQVKTFGGSAAQLGNQLSELAQDIGGVIASGLGLDEPSAQFTEMVKKIRDELEELKPFVVNVMTNLRLSFLKFIDSIYMTISAASSGISSMLGTIVSVAAKTSAAIKGIFSDDDKPPQALVDMRNFLQEISTKQGKAAEDAFNRLSKPLETADDTMKRLNKSTERLKDIATKTSNVKIDIVSADQKKAVDELAALLDELRRKNEAAGGGEKAKAQEGYQAELAQIKKQSDHLQELGILKQNSASIDKANTLAQSELAKKIAMIDQKNFDEQLQKTTELGLKLAASSSTEFDLIDQKAALETSMIMKKQQEQVLNGDITDSLREQYATQLKMVGEQAKLEKLKSQKQNNPFTAQLEAITKAANAAKDAGKASGNPATQAIGEAGGKLADSLGGVFSSGAMEIAGSIMNVGGAIMDMASGIVDQVTGFVEKVFNFIPGILDKVAHMFDVIAEFPKVMSKAVSGLFKSVIHVITDFIPGLIKMVPDILDTIITGLFEKIPEAMQKLFETIPDLMEKLSDKMPILAQKLIRGLIASGPQLIVQLIKFIAKMLPQTFKDSILKAIPAMIKSLVSGIGDGLKAAWKAIFTGKMDFGKSITEGFTNGIKKLTGATSNIFSVSDLTDAASNPFAALKAQTKKAEDILARLKAIWMWVYDHIIEPMITSLRTVWGWVLTGLDLAWKTLVAAATIAGELFARAWEILSETAKAAWDVMTVVLGEAWNIMVQTLKATWSVMTTLMQGAWKIMIATFKAVWDLAIVAFDAVVKILKGVWDVALAWFQLLTDSLKAVWNFAIGSLMSAWNTLKAVWDTVMDMFSGKIGLLDGVRKIFGEMFDGAVKPFKQLVIDMGGAFDKFFGGIKDAGAKIWDGLKEAFTKGGDILKGLGTTIWDGLKAALGKIGTTFSDLGYGIWSGLRNALGQVGEIFSGLGAKIWSGLTDSFGNIGEVMKGWGTQIWEGLKSVFNLNSLMGASGGGGGGFLSSIGLAEGGMVKGSALVPGDSMLNDKYLRLLSADEAVISRSKMKDPMINAVVKSILNGQFNSEMLMRLLVNSAQGRQGLGLAMGGVVGGTPQSLSLVQGGLSGIGGSRSSAPPVQQSFTISVGFQTTQRIDEAFIKSKVAPVVKDEIRKASLSGGRIVYKQGVV